MQVFVSKGIGYFGEANTAFKKMRIITVVRNLDGFPFKRKGELKTTLFESVQKFKPELNKLDTYVTVRS
ncbi:MAG TPA: hypothetical protein VMR70_02645 [Flavisolibacter sp.]|nr:hypothetical protein [Flavisolibacter sp.]